MNAVFDTQVPSVSNVFDLITQRLTALSQASSGCQQVLARSQTLRQWTSQRLRERMIQILPQSGLVVSNPDAIFFNRRAEDGSIISTGMTELLIEILRSGASSRLDPKAVFYTRHATLASEHALTSTQIQHVRSVMDAVGPGVFSGYGAYLNDLWKQDITHPVTPQHTQPASQVLLELQRDALMCEIDLRVRCRAMSVTEQNRLLDVISRQSTTGVYGVSWGTSSGMRVPLFSTYIVTQSELSSKTPSGVSFLVMPCKGIERFESLDELSEILARRLSKTERDPHLFAAMALSDQGRFRPGMSVPADAWRYQSLSRPLMEDHLQALQMKQAQDLGFLLEQPLLEADRWYEHLERVQLCADLDDAMGHRFTLCSVRADAFMAPHWRKYAKPSDKADLLALEKSQRSLKDNVAKRLAGVESFSAFAHHELTNYLYSRLGTRIDPSDVRVSLSDSITLDDDHALAVKYEKSLFEFALSGLPHTREGMSFAPQTNDINAGFTEMFVKDMVNELNLHHRYGVALRQAYEDPDTLRQMVKHRDSAIALSALTASLRGHLVQADSHALLSRIRGNQPQSGVTYSMGSLYLLGTHTRFNDLIVFSAKTQSDEHFVLYAPGAPGGRDFFEFVSWRQLCFGVGDWLATNAGRSYVHGQLSGPREREHVSVLANVNLKPSVWGEHSCLFVRCQGDGYEDNLADLVSQKVARTLQAAELAAPAMDTQASFASPAIQALMDARIEALNTEFKKLSPGLVDFRQYAHEQTAAVLNAYLSSNGYMDYVDPDTLYLGLGQAYSETPDFGENSELHQFTELMMLGNEDILSHRPQIHLYSSTGVDIRKLPIGLIKFMDKHVREADMGARYMDYLEQEFLGRKSPHYLRRKLLMAKRIQYEMSRAALKEFMRGQLDEAQYTWLRHTVVGLDRKPRPGRGTSAVSAFRIADQIIEGVYIFRDFNATHPDFNLLYTPGAPDGIDFRHLKDYAELLESPQMRSYYYARVAYQGQARVGSFFEKLQRGGKFDEDFIRIVNRMEYRISDAEQLYGNMIERMIADVDAQTESHAEARMAKAWSVIQWLGNVLLVPFPAVRIAWGIFVSAVKIYQGVDAYLSGDRATALPLLLKGVMGLVTGGNAARKLFSASQLAAKGVGVPVGVWVWHKLEFEGKMQKAVNEFLREQAKSLIVA